MKTNKLSILSTVLLFVCSAMGCHSRPKVDITPHPVNARADSLYRQAVAILQSSYDVDSTRKSISLLDRALTIDSLNPDYYGTKAKLLAEMGELDSALRVQTLALEKKAITGEYLFQLGLFQAAKDMNDSAHQNFGKSIEILEAVLEQYPDSLGAFILKESANALYQGADSVYMKDLDAIRKRFPKRLLEIEMIRRLKPLSLVKQIKKIHIENEYKIDFDLDSLVNEMEKKEGMAEY